MYDIIHRHQIPGILELAVQWSPSKPLRIIDPEDGRGRQLFQVRNLEFCVRVACDTNDRVRVQEFAYSFDYRGQRRRFGMTCGENGLQGEPQGYDLIAEGYQFITDVGFGVSQILPVLVLCYYAPEGATIILEQPEIHLHPSVQAGLADVFIDTIRHRKVQIILESHSEHLLRRLQRRIAERRLDAEQASLYFVQMEEGTSKLERLELDLFGNIKNWPPRFFGDEVGDLMAMAEAEMRYLHERETAE